MTYRRLPDSITSERGSSAARPPLPRWTVPVVAVGVSIIAGATLLVMWWWVNRLPLTAEAKAGAHLDVVKVASGIVVGGGGLFALYLAARRQRTQELELAQRERVHEHTMQVAEAVERDAAARRVTDLYAKAVEQLGSDKAAVRLGGLYALSRLGQDNPDQRETILNVVCAYLRMMYAPPDSKNIEKIKQLQTADPDQAARLLTEEVERTEEGEVRKTAQRILATHLRPDFDADGRARNPAYWPGTFRLDLAGAVLTSFDFAGCVVGSADFTKTTFVYDTVFVGSGFAQAKFEGARFAGRSDFSFAKFAGETSFELSIFWVASFGCARFGGDTSFAEAKFAGKTSFRGAAFSGRVDLSSATVYAASDAAGASDWPAGWMAPLPRRVPKIQPWIQLEYIAELDGGE